MNKTIYLPGEEIQIVYSIENLQQISIKIFEISLVQTISIGNKQQTLKLVKAIISNMNYRDNRYITDVVSLPIPSCILPPSYQFKDLVDIIYQIRFDLHIQGSSPHYQFHYPTILGTDSSQNDQPPSYESIMQNTNFI